VASAAPTFASRLRRPHPVVARRFALGFDSLPALLQSELAWNPRRARLSLRMATIATLCAGFEAAMHIDSVLGVYIIWILVGTPQAMLSLRKGLAFLGALGATVALAFPLAGMLVEAPWLMLAFIASFVGLTSYLNRLRNLGGLVLIVQVVVLDTCYGAVFDPANFGWASAELFAGAVVAVLTVIVFDQVLWPDPAEAVLIASLAESLGRSAGRIREADRLYFAPTPVSRIVPLTSDLPTRLELLTRATLEGLSPQRRAFLLAAITREARLHNAIDRMIILAVAAVPRELRTELRPEFAQAVAALAQALDELRKSVVPRLQAGDLTAPPAVIALVDPPLAALQARIVAARPDYASRGAAEVANLAAYHQSLRAIASLVERPLQATLGDPDLALPAATPPRPLLPLDYEAVRYSAKVAVATIAGFITGLTAHRADLSSILTTIIVTVMPTYGASLRKMILRLAGVIVGGALTIAAIIVVAPNFTSLPSYLIAIFAVLLVSGYSGLGSGRTAYAGKQIGTTFLLIFIGLGPALRIEEPLWRLWAVALGTLIATVAATVITPEYAHEALAPRLRKILRATLELVPGSAAAADAARMNAELTAITTAQAEMLSVADDAALEGSAARVDPAAMVDAVGTLRRIAYRLGSIDRDRLEVPTPPLAAAARAARRAAEGAVREHLQGWLDHFEGPDYLSSTAAVALTASHSAEELVQQVASFADQIAADGFAQIGEWKIAPRRAILAEIESWQRLSQLLVELDGHLARVPLAAA